MVQGEKGEHENGRIEEKRESFLRVEIFREENHVRQSALKFWLERQDSY